MTELTIHSIRARPVIAPLARPITTASGAVPAAPLVLIDIQTNEGPVGSAYIFTYLPALLEPAVALLNTLAETLSGRSATPRAVMAQVEAQFRLAGIQGVTAMVVSGIDMALWDALAKSKDMSVAAMLGGTEDPLPCYDSMGIFVPGRDDDQISRSIAAGNRAIKIKVGGGPLADDLEALRVLRSITGPDIALMIDYNQSLTPPEAIRRVRAIEDAGLDIAWVEEPVPAEDFAGHVTVRRGISTPVQTGENWWFPADAARAIAAGISDHAMLDIMKIGGFTGWLRASAMAEAASMPVSSHLFHETSAHALACTPNAHLVEILDIAAGILQTPVPVKNGTVAPRGPGLGIAWDESAAARHLVT